MVNINSRPIIIIGKMGVGKSTVLDILRNTYSTRNLHYERITTYTTRNARSGEPKDAYHFISNDEFDKLTSAGEFAESYETVKDGKRIQYGSKLEDYENVNNTFPYTEGICIKTIILDPSGLKKVLKILKPSNCTVIYLKAKDDVLIERCMKRGSENKYEILERLSKENESFNSIEACCDLVINCDHSTADEVANMIDRYVHYDLF